MVELDELKKIIKERGFTIASLERKAQVANGTIGKWGSKTHTPKLETLLKVANVLECSVYDFVSRDIR